MEKKLNEFNIDELVKKTYNDIAKWHNDDSSSPGLKQLTFEVIQNITASVFKHLDIPFNGEIKLDDETKKIALEKYKKQSS